MVCGVKSYVPQRAQHIIGPDKDYDARHAIEGQGVVCPLEEVVRHVAIDACVNDVDASTETLPQQMEVVRAAPPVREAVTHAHERRRGSSATYSTTLAGGRGSILGRLERAAECPAHASAAAPAAEAAAHG